MSFKMYKLQKIEIKDNLCSDFNQVFKNILVSFDLDKILLKMMIYSCTENLSKFRYYAFRIKDFKDSIVFEKEIKDTVNWFDISIAVNMSNDFIRDLKNKIDWENISEYQDLSENFIREFQDKANWNRISRYQKLSEDFIREFQDRINWYFISAKQKLSEDFMKEFRKKIYWREIKTRTDLNISQIRLKEIRNTDVDPMLKNFRFDKGIFR